MSYDPKCHALAVAFLSDHEPENGIRDLAAADLAQQVQDLIEWFIECDLVELRKENSQFGAGA